MSNIFVLDWNHLLSRPGQFAIALCVALAGCSYSAPRWQHQIESGIPLPGSGFGVRILGWSTDGSECYVELFGHSGGTSDTPVVRQVYRVGATDPIGPIAIASLPDTMLSPKNGEFDSRRRLHIWATDVSVQ